MLVPEVGATFSPRKPVTSEQQVSNRPPERRAVRLSHLLAEVALSSGVALPLPLQQDIWQQTCTCHTEPYALTPEGPLFCVLSPPTFRPGALDGVGRCWQQLGG